MNHQSVWREGVSFYGGTFALYQCIICGSGEVFRESLTNSVPMTL